MANGSDPHDSLKEPTEIRCAYIRTKGEIAVSREGYTSEVQEELEAKRQYSVCMCVYVYAHVCGVCAHMRVWVESLCS